MVDMEEVIKGLVEISNYFFSVYHHSKDREEINKAKDRCDAAEDAIALLKEQEQKTGKWALDDEDANSWECSECGGLLIINDGTPHENDWYFCPYCGSKLEEQAVKWE